VRIGQLVQQALSMGARRVWVWRPSWPDNAYLEVRFNERGIVEPVGTAVLEDADGNVRSTQTVAMLYAPIEDDYEVY
jgi:hypothetical protein